jgi:hypothetical protein
LTSLPLVLPIEHPQVDLLLLVRLFPARAPPLLLEDLLSGAASAPRSQICGLLVMLMQLLELVELQLLELLPRLELELLPRLERVLVVIECLPALAV